MKRTRQTGLSATSVHDIGTFTSYGLPDAGFLVTPVLALASPLMFNTRRRWLTGELPDNLEGRESIGHQPCSPAFWYRDQIGSCSGCATARPEPTIGTEANSKVDSPMVSFVLNNCIRQTAPERSSDEGLLRALSSDRARQPVALGCVAAIVIVGVVDNVLGPLVTLALFYSVPVIAAAWVFGRRAGTALAVLVSAVGVLVYEIHPHGSPVGVASWNGLSRVAYYVILAWLVSGQRRLYNKLQSLASIDALTAALNRRAFLAAGTRELERARRVGEPVAVLFADIDGLKHTNDVYGHASGDAAIARFGRVALGTVRSIDVVGGLGGDEFALLLPGADHKSARQIADRLIEQLSDTHDGPAVPVSIGLATAGGHDNIESILQRAGNAMYQIKRSRPTPRGLRQLPPTSPAANVSNPAQMDSAGTVRSVVRPTRSGCSQGVSNRKHHAVWNSTERPDVEAPDGIAVAFPSFSRSKE